jgi:large subunit ribosomal protein L10
MASQSILEQKRTQIDAIKEQIKNAKGLVIVNYIGLTVAEDTAFRKSLRERGINYSVLKNRLVKMAFNELGYNDFDEALNGPSALAFSNDDAVGAAKAIIESASSYSKISVKCGMAEGNFIDAAGIKMLASLPSKDIMIAKLLGTMQAPISNLVYCLNGLISGLAICLNKIAEQKAQ